MGKAERLEEGGDEAADETREEEVWEAELRGTIGVPHLL